ncbi:MAG: proton-conducting transporter membrane subunit [Bacillota bacterium]|nr:proton-conducting transporter membrane subunit [Bacillota bacterium]
MRITDHFPLTIVVGTLLGAYLSPIVGHVRRRWLPPFAVGVTLLALIQAIQLNIRVRDCGELTYQLGGWPAPWGIELLVGPAAALMVLVLAAISTLIAVYCMAYIDHEVAPHAQSWYYAAFLLLLAGMLGMAVTNDLFNTFVMMEITTIGACALVAAKDSRRAAEAALRYLLLASLASTLILLGIGMIYMITGNLNLTYLTRELETVWRQYPRLATTSLGLLTLGFALKAALFPLHVWLPEAHSAAPTPSSAMLSGLVVKIYAFSLIKMNYVVFRPILGIVAPLRELLILLSAAAIIGGSLFALVQDDIKRLLAYSTVAQVGYIFLGAGLGTPSAVMAAFFQIISHSIMKTCLFLSAGIIAERTGRRKIALMDGMGRVLPLTSAAFTVAALSMIGLPLLSGFIAKWHLFLGGLEAERPVFIGLILMSGLLNAAYYLPVIWRFYFVEPQVCPVIHGDPAGDAGALGAPGSWPPPGIRRRILSRLEAPLPMLLPVVALALACIVLGVWTGPTIAHLAGVAQTIIGGPGR